MCRETDALKLRPEHQPDRAVDQIRKNRAEREEPEIHRLIAEGVSGEGDGRTDVPEQHRWLGNEDRPAVDATWRILAFRLILLSRRQHQIAGPTHAAGERSNGTTVA